MPWETSQPKLMSFATAKESKYYGVLQYQMIRLVETGVWRVILFVHVIEIIV